MGDWSFAGGMRANPELCTRYVILERLGEGTYGEVYKGKRKSDGLIVALKETRDPQCASREAEVLVALDHPNIIKLIEYFVQGSNLILVLEFVPTDLYQVIQASDRRIREAEVKGWMLQLLRGVAACHRASILHRDLKPSNLLVSGDGSLKVADFGQARVVCAQGAVPSAVNDIGFQGDVGKKTHNVEKDTINAWIEGKSVVKSIEPPVKETRLETKAVMTITEEGLEETGVETAEHGRSRCFCVESDYNQNNGGGNSIGCRSLNCSMVKREGLIVARSNHFVDLEKTMEAAGEGTRDKELGRREWVLAEKNIGGPAQEKDSDFFYKLRSFLKRRGRKPHKQSRRGEDKAGDVETSQFLLEEDRARPDCLQEDDTTAVLHQSVHHDVISVPGPMAGSQPRAHLEMWADKISFKEMEVAKTGADHTDDVGIRPLMGNESTEEEILLKALDRPGSCVLENSYANVYQPVVENPFDGTYVTQSFGDSGRMIMNSGSHGHGGRNDTGSESKRRKAYALETGTEETMFAEHSLGARDEAGGDGAQGNPSLSNQDTPVDMETDTLLTELEAVRNRILYGKHRKTDLQKGEAAPLPQSGDSIHSTGHFELPAEASTLKSDDLSLPMASNLPKKSKDVKVEAEEAENTVRVLGLERVHNGVEGYIREVECAEEGTVQCGPEKESWKGTTVRFWDGNRRMWELADEASDEDRRSEDQTNAQWYDGNCGHDRGGVNGSYYGDVSHGVDRGQGKDAYGETEIDNTDQEDGDPTGQTWWFRPPDVRDSYVKGKLEVHEEGFQTEEASPYFRGDFGEYGQEMLQEIEVHSQQEETESTYSSENGNKGSDLSPFVGTRWYKAPELLYGATKYGKGLDMWAVGCIFAELLSGKPLFPGITDIDQLSRIVRVLGAAKENVWPGVSLLPDFDKISFSDERPLLSFRSLIPQASPSAIKLLEKLLVYDPERRLSSEAVLRDIYFLEDPLPALPHDLKVPSFRRDSSASEEWGEWRDPGSPFSDFEILDSAP